MVELNGTLPILTNMQFNSLVPELDVRDFARSLDFYTKMLGFTVLDRRAEPDFALLAYGDAQLMIQQLTSSGWYAPEADTPLGRGVNFQIRTKDIASLVARLKAYDYPIERLPYESWRKSAGETIGEIEIHVFDPDGYFLRFSQVIGVRSE